MFCTIKLLIRSFVLLYVFVVFFFFKQKTAYEMRISDWSSDVCSSDLLSLPGSRPGNPCPSLTPDLSGEARCRGRMGPRDKPEGDNWSGLARHPAAWICGVRRLYAPAGVQIGRAHVGTPVTNAQLVCRLQLEKNK